MEPSDRELLLLLVQYSKEHRIPNGERMEIFQRLTKIETKLEEIGKTLPRLPCSRQAEVMADLSTRIEKMRYVITMSVLALVFSALAAFGSLTNIKDQRDYRRTSSNE